MKFIEIKPQHLKVNEKYRVYTNHSLKNGRFIKKIPDAYLFLVNNYISYIPYNMYCTFFYPMFQKEKRQEAMERRAVNMILQRIIGDPFFVW